MELPKRTLGRTGLEVTQLGFGTALRLRPEDNFGEAGLARFIGVSSTAPHLMNFAQTGAFDAFQVPYSALERTHEDMIQKVADAGAGSIVRGGIAQGGRNQNTERWDLWERSGLNELAGGMNRYEFVLRFTLTHPACQTTIVGTTQRDHLSSNVAAALAGPLPQGVYDEAKERLAQMGEEPYKSDP